MNVEINESVNVLVHQIWMWMCRYEIFWTCSCYHTKCECGDQWECGCIGLSNMNVNLNVNVKLLPYKMWIWWWMSVNVFVHQIWMCQYAFFLMCSCCHTKCECCNKLWMWFIKFDCEIIGVRNCECEADAKIWMSEWGVVSERSAEFLATFSAFYGQRSVTAAWATRSPWSIWKY